VKTIEMLVNVLQKGTGYAFIYFGIRAALGVLHPVAIVAPYAYEQGSLIGIVVSVVLGLCVLGIAICVLVPMLSTGTWFLKRGELPGINMRFVLKKNETVQIMYLNQQQQYADVAYFPFNSGAKQKRIRFDSYQNVEQGKRYIFTGKGLVSVLT
jgi:hypothetical protein